MRIAILILSTLLSAVRPNVTGLVEMPATSARGIRMAVLYTGDGGWRATDRGLARILAENGIPVAGINTLHYFWTRRTPEQAAEDFSRILLYYLSAWKKERVVVIGYSFGADVLPFILTRIPKPLLDRVEILALLAPTRTADLEFHLRQWFSGHASKNAKPVLPELQKLKDLRIVAFCGKLDGEALCRDLPATIKQISLPGASHRFDNFYSPIAQEILKEIQQ